MDNTKDKWIVMQEDLFHGHKGRIIITTSERVTKNQPPIAQDIVDAATAFYICASFNEQNEYTKGEAVAEVWMPGSEADPRWVVKVNNEICFVTSCNDEANAKEFVRRWNDFHDEQVDLLDVLEMAENWLKAISKTKGGLVLMVQACPDKAEEHTRRKIQVAIKNARAKQSK